MASKRIEYDMHAEDQMRDRGFNRSDVRWLLMEGLTVDADQSPGSETVFAKRGRLGRRESQVLYLENAERIYVTTVMEILSRGALAREKARKKRGKR